jgi:L-fuculose-phosphate aldolase
MASVDSSPFTAAQRSALAEAARTIGRSGMVIGSAGNASIRSGGLMLITRRDSTLEQLAEEDLIEVSIAADGPATRYPAERRPSSETPVHRAIYRERDAGAIVHTHALYATVLSTLVSELPAIHYAVTAFGGPVRVADYATFGTERLADAVVAALRDRSAALMANHGAVVIGRDIEHALSLAITLEWLASVHYHALCAGKPRILTDAQLAEVREQQRRFEA